MSCPKECKLTAEQLEWLRALRAALGPKELAELDAVLNSLRDVKTARSVFTSGWATLKAFIKEVVVFIAFVSTAVGLFLQHFNK